MQVKTYTGKLILRYFKQKGYVLLGGRKDKLIACQMLAVGMTNVALARLQNQVYKAALFTTSYQKTVLSIQLSTIT
jgi:uncharacterized membrane protein YiaA